MNLQLGDTRLIISECQRQGLSDFYTAYVLATAYHETAHTMKPVREYGGETYLKSKKYYPYVGMGYVQLTWDYNYKKASDALGVDFMKTPSLLLVPKYAVVILVTGMREGWFTGKKLSSYATYKDMRRIVNGTDKADLIASYADEYLKDLNTSVTIVVPPVATQPVTESVSEVKAPTIASFISRLLHSLFGGK